MTTHSPFPAQTRIWLAALHYVLAALLLGGLDRPAQAQRDPFHTPVIDSIIAAEDSIAAATVDSAGTSADDQHAILRGLNALDDVLPPRLFEILLVLSFVVIPMGCAGGFAAVALFSESGCLRILLAIMGWLAALLGGLIGGGLLGTLLGGGLSFFIWTGVISGGMGYPIVFAYAQTRIEQLPGEVYLTWKHTLRGGALIGTGAASAASLARSAGALFKGGGGSFGGGGASGAFGGGKATQVAAASAHGTTAPGTVGVTSSAVSATAGRAASATAETSAGGGRIKRWTQAVVGFARRLRWYHGVGFVLVGLVFLPVGMGVTAIFQRPRLLLWIAGVYTLCRAYWLLVRTTGGDLPGAIASIFTMLLFMAPFVGGALAAESQAPQWHLAIILILAAGIEVGFFVLPDNRPKAEPPSDRAAPFRGGTASASW